MTILAIKGALYLNVSPLRYNIRLYRPRPETLDGTWTFPQAQAVN